MTQSKNSIIIFLGVVDIIITVVVIIVIAQGFDINGVVIKMDIHEGLLKTAHYSKYFGTDTSIL